MSSNLITQIAEVVGVSAIVSAAVNFILEHWKFEQERASARQEAQLKYSIKNYPQFASILNGVVNDLSRCRNLLIAVNTGTAKPEVLEQGIIDLLYHLRQLYSYEQQFQSQQGKLFRLGNQISEELANALYQLGKTNLSLSSDDETLLMQKFNFKTLEEFREHFLNAQTDPVVKGIHDTIMNVIKRVYSEKFARKNFDTLSRLLLMEIQSIRLPGYDRKPIPLSKPDQDYIKAVQRIPTMFFSNTSIDNMKVPLRIWVYNHWSREIRYQPSEVQIRVSVNVEGNIKKVADLYLFDPRDEKKRKVLKLKPGQTLACEWDRKQEDGQIAKGSFRICHLPDAGDSAFVITYNLL